MESVTNEENDKTKKISPLCEDDLLVMSTFLVKSPTSYAKGMDLLSNFS